MIKVEYKHNDDEPVCYVIESEDYDKLRKISDFLQSMEKCDADQRRDLGHKIWLILNNVERNRYEG